MAEFTGIGWTHHTFNPWWGCIRVSPGCVNCYAETWDRRMGGGHWGPVAPRRFFGDAHWKEPLKWARKAREAGERRRVFCGSMCDWAEDREDLYAWRGRLFELIKATPELDWLLLSKRIADVPRFLPWFRPGLMPHDRTGAATAAIFGADAMRATGTWDKPWPNIWIGTTVEDRQRAAERIPVLARIPAVVRFLSMEPLLEAVDLTLYPQDIDWVIAGCESGQDMRPARADWFRQLRDQCRAAGRAYFLKQAEPEWGPVPAQDTGEPIPHPYRRSGPGRLVIISGGPGARAKRDGVLEAPYLDGRQYLEIPTPRAVA